ncbi:L-threonylcarbamoyladenylate synthase [Acetivibrio straminisolvens]|uniref:Threonylcarbamoyl-AMP synthase n=1 Tax=Acetivibrio straminisolvens JCM 21531 TaxID=1294263 RepID=W4V3I0_9FIRM|nr:L-threonylcarbamoyladenylate synthase [Acetivibrio straminisolvens]GAE87289.1 YrdC/Sua5 family protein [Acetivibrio straminisolvens JCM 21531]
MKTEILKIQPDNIDSEKIKYAAEVLRGGGIVAFPTETVYGLGADALNENAVKKIFEAKGRPSDNPLIVHITGKESVDGLAAVVSPQAQVLMDRFWPGPLTLVVEKSGKIPSAITAGLSTVGLRAPSHPIALALIREAGIPIAAPSANLSGKPSPTASKHVIDDLYGRVDVIIDGGDADIGVESTVLDVTTDVPVILRPGGVSFEQLRDVLGNVSIDPSLMKKPSEDFVPRAPGMKYTHYSPKADVIVVEGEPQKVAEKINSLIMEYQSKNIPVGVLATEQTKELYKGIPYITLGDRLEPETIAANLFKAFRDFDDIGIKVILAEAINNEGIGLAVMNRMKKAAGYNIIKAT